MTNQTPFPQPTQQPPVGPSPIAAPAAPAQKNTLGLIGLILGIVGFALACIPIVGVIGWPLMLAGLVLGIIGVTRTGAKKGTSIAAIIVSVVGPVVAIIVTVGILADSGGKAIEDALKDLGTSPSVSAPADGADADGGANSDAGSTRDNPAPIGTTITDGDWSVTINSVDLDANDLVANESEYNDPPEDGTTFILVNLTTTYNGDDANGSMPWVSVDYVTVDGTTISTSDVWATIPDELDRLSNLYSGASATGNLLLQVPEDTADQGVLAVTPTLMADKVFVAVK